MQVGGASGRTVPAEQFQRKLGFEDLATGGSVIVIGPHHLDYNFWRYHFEQNHAELQKAKAPRGAGPMTTEETNKPAYPKAGPLSNAKGRS